MTRLTIRTAGLLGILLLHLGCGRVGFDFEAPREQPQEPIEINADVSSVLDASLARHESQTGQPVDMLAPSRDPGAMQATPPRCDEEDCPWWNDSYRVRFPLLLASVSDLTESRDVPIRVSLDRGAIDAACGVDAHEHFRFVLPHGATVLAHEVEFPLMASVIEAWVKFPALGGEDPLDFFWLYCDSTTSPSPPSPHSVWSPSYEAVWHLGEAAAGVGGADVYRDSTGHAHDGTDLIDSDDKQGVIGLGVSFGGDDRIEVDSGLLDGVSQFTVSAWVRPERLDDYQAVFRHTTDPDGSYTRMVTMNDGTVRLRINRQFARTTRPVLSRDVWAWWVMVYDGTAEEPTRRLRFYLDGEEIPLTFDGEIDRENGAGRHAFLIGQHEEFRGNIDELRVSQTARSPDWIALQNRSMLGMLVRMDRPEYRP